MSLADKYITKQGGAVPKRQEAVFDTLAVPVTPRRWAAEEKLAFDEIDPSAVYLVGALTPVSGSVHDTDGQIVTSWGGLTGVVLLRTGQSSAPPWADKITAAHTRGPVPVRLLARLWVPSDRHAERFETICDKTLSALGAVPAVNGYHALAHDTNLAGILTTLKGAGKAHGMQWVETDRELYETCRRLVDRAQAIGR